MKTRRQWLHDYLGELAAIHSSRAGVAETSYYPALSNLFNEVGESLSPRVSCVLQLANRGAGNPDGGFFTASQMQETGQRDWPAPMPERGVIEVKSTADDAWVVADSRQVTQYWKRYGLVLVTNYRDFLLVGRDKAGSPVQLEVFRLAESEGEFWELARHPARAASALAERFGEFLIRTLLYAAPLCSPEDVAWFLASYARDAKARLEGVDLPALINVREALEEALGLRFEGEKGDHFFRSSLVQTLFYGVFSAWVLWHKENPRRSDAFDWRSAAWSLHVPMIRALFDQVAAPSRLRPLGLVEPLEWAAAALSRVDRPVFFSTFEEGHAVQYFYEPFLRQFDPELRKQLGVWYTPPEIVEYMVERVDRVLREELEIADGLADPCVYVLDPCCGTGAYLVEALRRIAKTIKENRGWDALDRLDVKKAAMQRVFGFDIMPAPFVVAHLQLGMLLRSMNAPLDDAAGERVAVYLTNALTGWEPPKEPKQHLIFPEMEAERDAAEEIKRDKPILVILGNPPYNAYAGVSPNEEQGLVEPYKEGLNRPVSEGGWGIKKFNLDDLYIRFFRLAERRIAEMTGKGVVCFISNHSWISDPSFVVLRQHLFESFDKFWIENLHGNRKISEYAPDGRTSETVFAIAGFSPGIQQGVATSLWVKTGVGSKRARVHFRDDIDAARAVERRAQLLASLNQKRFDARYERARPTPLNRYSFRPASVAESYLEWPKVTELCAVAPSNGLMEKRGGALIDTDPDALARRMKAYFNRKLDWDEYKERGYGLTKKQAAFDPKQARARALAAEQFDAERIVRYAVRPFDTRYCYYTAVNPVWNRPRPSLWAQCWKGNRFLLTRFRAAKAPEGAPIFFTPHLSDDHCLAPDAVAIPLQVRNGARLRRPAQASLFAALGEEALPDAPVANLSGAARTYLSALKLTNPDEDAETAGLLWMHALAVGFAPAYLAENADGLRQDWPRVPLPGSRKALMRSAELGSRVAELLDTETPVRGVSTGAIRAELKPLAPLITPTGGRVNLGLTAGWGHAGKGDAVMPGKGKLLQRPAEYRGELAARWGESVLDVYLNEHAYWANVPIRVWEYYIGGYQVVKKWLSYREQELLGRELPPEEARYVTEMVRRLAALLLLEPELDANYADIRDHAHPWKP